ncbi:MAG TPA: ADOP family duplicated permease [Thermoanaerobaculia bacterium]|nr:ADOP family duplicated permease [Thermoanaerobaculia bacterium]
MFPEPSEPSEPSEPFEPSGPSGPFRRFPGALAGRAWRLARGLAGGLWRLMRRGQAEAELDEELRGFFAAAVAAKVQSGMGEAQARRAIRIEMGSPDAVKEQVRAAAWETALDCCRQDVAFGLRMLRRSPATTAAAIATLALGFGANTAVFSIVDALLWRPLPVADPGRLVQLTFRKQAGPLQDNFSHAHLAEIRELTAGAFSGLMGFQFGVDGLGLPGSGGAFRLLTSYVTGDYFAVLGIKPARGRFLVPAEGRTPGADPVVVLAWSCWQRRFAGDPAVVGRKVLLNGQPVTVVGVAPEGFHGVRALVDTEAWLPLAMAIPLEGFSKDFLANRGIRNLIVMARLRPGVDLPRARAALVLAAAGLARQHPATDQGLRLAAWPEKLARPSPQSAGRTAAVARAFLLLAALVLALACINVANILLVRATTREGEMVIRAALGAARLRLVRQLLTEGLVLAMAGAAAGTLAGIGCCGALLRLHLPLGDAALVLAPRGDWRVLAQAAGAALAGGTLLGALPALRLPAGRLAAALRAGGRGLATGRHRLRDVLAAAQVGASLTLLIAAALFLRSLAGARQLALGYEPDQVVDFSLDVGGAGYTEAQGSVLYRELLRRVRTLPGVEAASLASAVPMGDNYFENTLLIPGYLSPPGQPPPLVDYDMVSPGYFATLRIPLLGGRDFTPADRRDSRPVAVVDQTMAERFWPRANPIGRGFALATRPGVSYQVVGIVKDVRNVGTRREAEPFFYLPLDQKYAAWQVLHVRTALPPLRIVPAVRSVIAGLAPSLAAFDVGPMREALGGMRGFLTLRLGAGLAGALGILGLVVAVVGLYGVISCAASQRRHEIGVRMALGAGRAAIVGLMLRHGLLIVGAGVAGGLLATPAMTGMIGSFLVGARGAELGTCAAVTLALVLVALAASLLPARRAARTDPNQVLRVQ